MKSDKLIAPLGIRNAYLDYALKVINGECTTISNGSSAHAGGPSYKGKSATVSVDGAIESTGTDGATVAVAGDDDDDDGDGDPDSDRTPLTPQKSRNTAKRREAQQKEKTMAQHTQQKARYTVTLQTALDRKPVTTANRILRMAELKVRIGLSQSTIYAAMKNGEFPASIPLGARAIGFLESEVDAWLESRINASKAA